MHGLETIIANNKIAEQNYGWTRNPFYGYPWSNGFTQPTFRITSSVSAPGNMKAVFVGSSNSPIQKAADPADQPQTPDAMMTNDPAQLAGPQSIQPPAKKKPNQAHKVNNPTIQVIGALCVQNNCRVMARFVITDSFAGIVRVKEITKDDIAIVDHFGAEKVVFFEELTDFTYMEMN